MTSLAKKQERAAQMDYVQRLGAEWKAARLAAANDASQTVVAQEEPTPPPQIEASVAVAVEPVEPSIEPTTEPVAPRLAISGDFRQIITEDFESYSSQILEKSSVFSHWLEKQENKFARLSGDPSARRYTLYVCSYERGSNFPIESIQVYLSSSFKIPLGATLARGDGLINILLEVDSLGGGSTILNEWLWCEPESSSVDVLHARGALDSEIYELWEAPQPALAPDPEPPKPVYRPQKPITFEEIARWFHRCECGAVVPHTQGSCDICQKSHAESLNNNLVLKVNS